MSTEPAPLYKVGFRVPFFADHEGVPMTLARAAHADPPFTVEDYLPDGVDDPYTTALIEESFTALEADALVAHFSGNWPVGDVKRTPVDIEGGYAGCRAVPIDGSGRPRGAYEFWRHDGPDVPVPVDGYYDLRFADDGPHTRPNLTVVPGGAAGGGAGDAVAELLGDAEDIPF